MTQVAVRSDQRGFALVLTMLMLVVFGAIVAGSFFAGWLEQQSAERVLFTTQAGEAAEAGITDALMTTAPEILSGLMVGGLPVPLPSLSVGQVTVQREVRRLTKVSSSSWPELPGGMLQAGRWQRARSDCSQNSWQIP